VSPKIEIWIRWKSSWSWNQYTSWNVFVSCIKYL